MPIYHIQYKLEYSNSDGTKTIIPSKTALLTKGPIIHVMIGIPQAISEQLALQGKPVPSPVTGNALIDTGANSTCIDESIAQKLGLPVIDVVKMASASHESTEANVYPTEIVIVGTPIKVNVDRTIGANLNGQGIIVLLGRDILQNLTVFYNGFAGEVTISL